MRTRRAYRSNRGFPMYEQDSRRPVDDRLLQQAIKKATWHFAHNRDEYKRVFRRRVTRHLRCKPSAVHFDDLSASLRRIRAAVLADADEKTYGWTNGYQIYVSRSVPMAFDELVGTLVHEELHCFCFARGRWLGSKTEHGCMKALGERPEYCK